MGEYVGYRSRPELPGVQMSNGVGDLFMAALALSASDLAAAEREKEFAAWFCSRDRVKLGYGVRGFNLEDLPWSRETFPTEHAFLVKAAAAALEKKGWDRLRMVYDPREDWLLETLAEFKALLERFSVEDVGKGEDRVWEHLKPAGYELCSRHRVYRHAQGCLLCNDAATLGKVQ